MLLKQAILLGTLLLWVSFVISCSSEIPEQNKVKGKQQKTSVFSDKLLPIKANSLKTTDGMEPSTIRRIMDKRKSSFKVCYKKALAENPKIKGEVLVAFTVSPTGRVSTVNVERSTLNNNETLDCIRRVVRHVQFPPIESGKRVKIEYPLIFAP